MFHGWPVFCPRALRPVSVFMQYVDRDNVFEFVEDVKNEYINCGTCLVFFVVLILQRKIMELVLQTNINMNSKKIEDADHINYCGLKTVGGESYFHFGSAWRGEDLKRYGKPGRQCCSDNNA